MLLMLTTVACTVLVLLQDSCKGGLAKASSEERLVLLPVAQASDERHFGGLSEESSPWKSSRTK